MLRVLLGEVSHTGVWNYRNDTLVTGYLVRPSISADLYAPSFRKSNDTPNIGHRIVILRCLHRDRRRMWLWWWTLDCLRSYRPTHEHIGGASAGRNARRGSGSAVGYPARCTGFRRGPRHGVLRRAGSRGGCLMAVQVTAAVPAYNGEVI